MAKETNFGDDSNLGPRFERFRFADNEQDKKKRIVFIDKVVLQERVHYKDGYGYMRCLQPEPCPACSAGISGSDRYGTKVLEYYTNLDGNVSKPFGYSVKAFVFGNGKGQGTYSMLHGIFKQLGDRMYVRDFIISCSNPKFQTMSFLPLETCFLAEMKRDKPKDFEEVKADYLQKMKDMDILRVVAPVVTADIMQQVVDGKIVRRSTKNVGTAPQGSASPAAVAPQTSVPSASSFGGVAVSPAATGAAATSAPKDEAKAMMESMTGDL